jgi:hypothetical protein
MNMVKTGLLAALIALSASAAQAFTPPYHIDSPSHRQSHYPVFW